MTCLLSMLSLADLGGIVHKITDMFSKQRCSPSMAGRDAQCNIALAYARSDAGLTLVELIIVITIVALLSTAAVPLVRFQVKRTKERELRADLWAIRRGIDEYKDRADLGGIQTKADSQNYPPDLDTLVNGVDIQDKHYRFLRSIPTDPMTKNKEWGLRSNQDEPDSDSFGGQGVFDVYSKSTGTALDGTKYSTW